MHYKQIIKQIINLRWHVLNTPELLGVMVLSAYAAREFAESLRIALAKHPGDPHLKEMAAGELATTNIMFDDYRGPGDHADYLWYFINKHNVRATLSGNAIMAEDAGVQYVRGVRELGNEVRIMSVISREQELSNIFSTILERATSWSQHPALLAFKHYLEEHVRLDSGEGGHADLVAGFSVDDSVVPFYDLRLELYEEALPVLVQ